MTPYSKGYLDEEKLLPGSAIGMDYGLLTPIPSVYSKPSFIPEKKIPIVDENKPHEQYLIDKKSKKRPQNVFIIKNPEKRD